jgi:phosphatidylglycerol:prolipoprotein diacylglycerol transferase
MKPELWGLPADWTFIALGSLAGIAVCWRIGHRWGLPPASFIALQLSLIVLGLLGSKLQSLLERGTAGDVGWELTSGFRYVGGIGAVLVGLFVLVRLRVIRVDGLEALDSLALAVCAAMAVVRVGCFLEGCCFGTVTDGPLGVVFPAASPAWRAQVMQGFLRADAEQSLPVHPLQLYFSL